MVDFKNVASGDYVPSSTGFVASIAKLPGGNPSTPAPMRFHLTTLGNFGTGNPVTKVKVQRVSGGSWFEVSGGSVTDNGTVSGFAYGVAIRVDVPTLSSPGTNATAPRVAFQVENLAVPRSLDHPVVTVGGHKFSNDLGATSEVLSLPGYGRLNPNVPSGGVPFKSLVFLTQEGAGTSFIESTYVDGDGSFKVQEGSSLAGANGQVAVLSFGEEHHVDFTDGTGTTDVWLDVLQYPI